MKKILVFQRQTSQDMTTELLSSAGLSRGYFFRERGPPSAEKKIRGPPSVEIARRAPAGPYAAAAATSKTFGQGQA